MNDGFPLLSLKETHFNSVLHELLWIVGGYTNIRYLLDNNVKIWTEWPYMYYKQKTEEYRETYSNELERFSVQENFDNMHESNKPHIRRILDKCKLLNQKEFAEKIKTNDEFANEWGDCGPIYGHQWRTWGKDEAWSGIDQLNNAIDIIKNNPDSRRMIVSAWNPGEIDEMLLPPCHALFQFYVADGKLSLMLYQRSCDLFLGVPFNIASYALLTLMMVVFHQKHKLALSLKIEN